MLQLGHIDELEVERESPIRPGGGADVDRPQLVVERLADRLVVAIAELLGLCPHLLLEHEERLSLLLRERLSQQGADQRNIAPEATLASASGLGGRGQAGRPPAKACRLAVPGVVC